MQKKSAISLEVADFFVSLHRRCIVGGIPHVGIVRCAGYEMTICIFFFVYMNFII